MLSVREILCKTLLNKSSLSDFTLNCYVGCSHKCLYCYARYMKKFRDRPEPWGEYVDVKINAPEALAKQLRRIKPPKEVFMSSICDGWQPIEAKYKLSRACLRLLLEAGLEVSILTKSCLIERDFDLLSSYKTPSLGMTLTTMDKGLQKLLEPYASETQERLNTLKRARDRGIDTWAFLGPFIPGFTDTNANLEALFRALEGLNLGKVYVDRLNLRWGVLESLKKGLGGRYFSQSRQLFYTLNQPTKYAQYTRNLRQKTRDLAVQFRLLDKLTVCF